MPVILPLFQKEKGVQKREDGSKQSVESARRTAIVK